MKKLLITGGFGKIGRYFIQNHLEKYHIRVADIQPQENVFPNSVEIVQLDLAEPNFDQKLFHGVDTVIHLAGIANPEATFDQVLTANIIATKNVFEAAFRAKCQRIIYASSVQTIEGYKGDIQVNKNMHVNPKNFYGVSKCFGEALGAYYAFENKISVICLRIGAYEFPEDFTEMNATDLSAYLHPDDFNQLLRKCIETNPIQFEIFNSISNNRFKRLDISEPIEKVGYHPVKNSFELFNLKK